MDNGIYTGVYKGKEILGFKKDHSYVFKLKHNGTTYSLNAILDATLEDEKEEVDIWIDYSSEISIRQNWDIKESDNGE